MPYHRPTVLPPVSPPGVRRSNQTYSPTAATAATAVATTQGVWRRSRSTGGVRPRRRGESRRGRWIVAAAVGGRNGTGLQFGFTFRARRVAGAAGSRAGDSAGAKRKPER